MATTLGVSERDVVDMNRRMAGPDHGLNAPLRADQDSEWQDRLVDEQHNQEETYAENEELSGRKALLATAMATLNEREQRIFTERRLKDEPTTLEDLAHEYGISRERVRQIEVRAFEKVQAAMKTEIEARRNAGQGG